MKTILLTGSGGFLGSNLKPYLQQGWNVLAPRSRELNLLDKNATAKYLASNKIDLIIHSAALGVRINPNDTAEQVARPNIVMFDNLAQSAVPIITFGSGAEYNKSRPLIKVKETDFGQSIPADPYGYCKYQISKKIETMPNAVNLRIFGIYGAGENPTRVTTCILNDILDGKPITLNQNVIFSFIYIEDFCRIVCRFVENMPKQKFINTACRQDISIKELAEMSKQLFKSNCRIDFKQEGFNKQYTCDTALLSNLLPDFKFTSYQEGMSKLYDNLKEAKNA